MNEKKNYHYFKIIMLIVLVAFITFVITSFMYLQKEEGKGEFLLSSSSSNSTQITNKIKEYQKVIDQYFLGEVDDEKLVEGAMKGYIEGLEDPYTEYIPASEMKDYLEDTKGNFIGIGIYMVKDTQTNKIAILSPIKNSPAETAGILPGDYIVAVDGVEYNADQMSQASEKIKGVEGSSVKLQIARDGKTLDFEIKRERIKVNPVEGKVLENNIGYIGFTSFDEDTAKDFKAKWEELEKQGIQSLIIDLRNNGGGIVSQALTIADYIADKGSVLLYEVDKNNKEKIEESEKDPMIHMPIVILTNENTASSSEILAGCLKDLGKAKIVGNKTYGKGVIQNVLQLSDGSGIKITAAKYLTPNKTEINKIGIEPDEKVELPESVENILRVDEKEDTQLQKAIEILK